MTIVKYLPVFISANRPKSGNERNSRTYSISNTMSIPELLSMALIGRNKYIWTFIKAFQTITSIIDQELKS